MSHATNGLTFNTLRGANEARVGHFKNKHGQLAHTTTDGSDWNPAQWIQATFGELGEFCQLRVDYETGRMSQEEYERLAPKELADFTIYSDILASRCLDATKGIGDDGQLADAAQVLMYAIAHLGAYANMRKKYDRGDITKEEFNLIKPQFLTTAIECLKELINGHMIGDNDRVVTPHPTGVNLGNAVMSKFNEVSERVGSPVWVDAEDWHMKKATVE